jgi:hypothetical protein
MIPHRYTARSVIRFVPVIRALLIQHRKNGVAVVKFNPVELDLNVNTAMARLRDAVHSLCSKFYTHPSIDSDELKRVWHLYKVVSNDDINVEIVSRGVELTPPNILIETPSGGVYTDSIVLRTDEAGFIEALTALALLFGRRLIKGQVDIIGDLSESLQHRITSENDVVFISDGQQKHHMI